MKPSDVLTAPCDLTQLGKTVQRLMHMIRLTRRRIYLYTLIVIFVVPF